MPAASTSTAPEANAELLNLIKTHLVKGPGDPPPPHPQAPAHLQSYLRKRELEEHELLSQVLPRLLSSCKLTTLCTASQGYAISAGWRDEEAAMVQIDCCDADAFQYAAVAKLRGPLQVIATFTESSTRTSEGATCIVDGEDVSSTTVLESAVHLHLISEEGGSQKEGPRPCRPLLALRLLGGEDLSGHAFLGSDQNQSSFERQLATSGLCQSFSDGRRVNRFELSDGINKRLPYVALVLAARAHLDPSFLSDDLAVAGCKPKAEYTSPAANYALLVSRLARAAESRAAEEKKVTTSLEGQRLLLWSQRRGSKEPESAGTVALVEALRRAGVQQAAPPPRASSRAVQAQAAKVTKVVACVAREGEQEGVSFLGGSFSLPDEIVSIVLSFSAPPFALCVAPLVAKAWLAVSHLPALHKTLKIPDKLSISAALTTLRQPRFSCVEALGLGKATKLGKTGAASLAKVCPRLRELDLSSLAVSRDDCASLHAALPELAGLSFHVDYSQSNALGIWGFWSTGKFCDAIAPFTSLLALKISWDQGMGRNLGDDVLSQLPKLCPNLELLSMVNAFLDNIPIYWSEGMLDERVRHEARDQKLTDLGVAALLGGCPQLRSLTLKPALFVETSFQKVSDQLKASPPLLKLKHLAVTDNPALSAAVSGSRLRLSLASQLDSFSYEDGADRAARLQARRREQAAAQEAAQRQYEAQRQEAAQRKEARRLRGTGFSSIKEVDNSWSRFGFVPKPSNAVGDAAGPSAGAAAAGHDEVVEI